MQSRQFVIERLIQLVEKHSGIKVRYEFRDSTHSHLIEVLPLSVFEGDEFYMEEEAKLEPEFEKLFPAENIVFISEGSLTEIKKPDFELGII